MIKITLIKKKNISSFLLEQIITGQTNKMSVANPEQDETLVQNESSNETPDK